MTSSTSLLDLNSAISKLAGKRVFFDPLHGNNGDRLIVLGAEKYLDERPDVQRVSNAEDAEAIVVTGGAGLSSVWGGAYDEVCRYGTGDFISKPLVILPSTMTFDHAGFVDCLHRRKAPTVLLARERRTLDRIQALTWPENVEIGLDHDTAFQLAGSPMIQQMRQHSQKKHILIVERRDAETLSGSHDAGVPVPKSFKRFVPAFIKRKIKQRGHLRARSKTEFASWATGLVPEHFPEYATSPTLFMDISLSRVFSFDQFCDAVRDAAVVVSTRLHVAILSALLDKPTIIVPGSTKYGKIQGIHEYSMDEMKHVKMVENPFEKNAAPQ